MTTNQENRLVSEKVTQLLIIFKQLINWKKNVNEFKRPLCIGYIHYEKTFNSTEHEAIFKALRSIGIKETYITILDDIYTGAAARVHMDNQASEEIPLLKGMRQGNPISPKLFTATIQVL